MEAGVVAGEVATVATMVDMAITMATIKTGGLVLLKIMAKKE